MYSAQRKKFGFTLIELLVVIAIIAILAAIGLVVYNSAQRTGRVGKRIGDLKALQTALEVYRQHFGFYPPTGIAAWKSQCDTATVPTPNDLIPALVPLYMQSIPSDPRMDSANTAQCYRYRVNSGLSSLDYKFQIFNLSELTVQEWVNQKNFVDPANDGGTDCSKIDAGTNPANKSWAIYSTNTGVADLVNNPACW